ncbi:MAG: AMIN domain-containing protein, partial [Armatimonadota bacterium]
MQQRAAQLTAVPLLLALALPAPAAAALQVHLLGAPAELSPAPRIDEGVALGAPASIVGRLGCRFVAEDARLTIITPAGRRVVVQADSDELLVDGEHRRLPREAFVAGEQLICPLRPVLEALGCVVSLSDDRSTLDVSVPVESIQVFADEEGTRVEVRAPLRVVGKVAYLADPDRWYVDLGGARVHLDHSATYVNLGEVLRVRWGQFDTSPSVARVVADLRGRVRARWAPHESGLGGELILGEVQGDEPGIDRHVPKVTRLATTTPGENTTVVRVELSDPVPVSYDVQRKPPRVYLEMPDAAPEMPIAPVSAESPFVKTVRLDGRAGRPGATLELSMHQLVQFEVRETEDPPAVNIIFRRERLKDQRIVID